MNRTDVRQHTDIDAGDVLGLRIDRFPGKAKMRAPIAVKWYFTVLTALLLSACESPAAENSAGEWPEWERFVARFVQADGRVIDVTFDQKTTSEGQSYALFFALVANQQERFDTLLKWTSDNLAEGQLGQMLPGWLWGKRDDGGWGIKDTNAAADADLWIAYTLLEASRLWRDPRYEVIGRHLLKQIAARDVVRAGATGVVLLPGPYGFNLSQNRYRINPSYTPGFMFAYLRNVDSSGPWGALWDNYLRLAPKMFAGGVAPDIVIVDSKGAVLPDTEKAPVGSYDAIRVYLWAGMSEGNSDELIRLLAPFAKTIRALGKPPEKVSPADGAVVKADYSPIAFTGAVLPFLSVLHEKESLDEQRSRLRVNAAEAKLGKATNYYDETLALFGQGWADGYYRFDAKGRLQPKWQP